MKITVKTEQYEFGRGHSPRGLTMTADRLHYQYLRHIRSITDRKIINCARKYGLKDTLAEIIWHTGLSSNKAKEFCCTEDK